MAKDPDDVQVLFVHASEGVGSPTGARRRRGGPASGALSGRLWHDNYALDYLDGTQIASPSGAPPTQVTGNGAVTPWADGSQYVFTDYAGSIEGYADLDVYETASGRSLYHLEFNGYAHGAEPSMASKTLAKIGLADDLTSPSERLVVDLTTGETVRRLEPGGAFSWLPDGRYLRVTDEGRVLAAALGQAEVEVGRLALPEGLALGSVWADPQGARLALSLTQLDGGDLARLTDTRLSHAANWSPDGAYVAFDVDTGFYCTSVGCTGSCDGRGRGLRPRGWRRRRGDSVEPQRPHQRRGRRGLMLTAGVNHQVGIAFFFERPSVD